MSRKRLKENKTRKENKTSSPSEQKNVSNPVVVSMLIIHQRYVTMRWAEQFRLLEIPFRYTSYSATGFFYDAGREFLVRNAMKRDDPEWVFFLDSDVIPPTNAIPRLIQIAREKDISVLAGLCWHKRLCEEDREECEVLVEEHIPKPNAFMKISENLSEGVVNYAPIVTGIKSYLGKNAVLEVDAVGAGCLLIKTDVFKKLDASNSNKPFFQYGHYRKDENSGKPLLKLGEDMYFCYRLTSELGIRPWISTEVKCDHIYYPAICSRRGSDGKMMI